MRALLPNQQCPTSVSYQRLPSRHQQWQEGSKWPAMEPPLVAMSQAVTHLALLLHWH